MAASPPSEPGNEALIRGHVTVKTETLFADSGFGKTGAVVFLEKLVGRQTATGRISELVQRNKAFEPPLLIIQAGTVVRFPNRDVVFHNVFSLSAGNQFDLGVYRQGASKSVRFGHPGVVDVFCNIHPQMVSTILVLQNPYFAQVAEDGTYSLRLPTGQHTLVAWWSKGPVARRQIDAEGNQAITVDFEVTDSGKSERHLNKYGQPYGRYE